MVQHRGIPYSVAAKKSCKTSTALHNPPSAYSTEGQRCGKSVPILCLLCEQDQPPQSASGQKVEKNVIEYQSLVSSQPSHWPGPLLEPLSIRIICT